MPDTRLVIRPADRNDYLFLINLVVEALEPYYGGDHVAHARRIMDTHLAGGTDQIGHFSSEQQMFVAEVGGELAGVIHLVGKRQGTFKISPLIVHPGYRGTRGLGGHLLAFAEDYAQSRGARQIYCTVAEQNRAALAFFLKHGFVVAGRSDSHYKAGITEVMLYKRFTSRAYEEQFDRPHISVLPFDERYSTQVHALLLGKLPETFSGIDDDWVMALFRGYSRRHTRDVNLKFKLVFVAVDRAHTVLGVAGATPKKGEPIKIMPFIATTLPAFVALLSDIPYQLRQYGHKLYMHIAPNTEETIALQQRRWRLDAAMPGAYHGDRVTQQWSLDILRDDTMRVIRVKQQFLDAIRARRKTLEVRVAYSSIRTIQPGERIQMASRADQQMVRVRAVRTYGGFEDMLAVEAYDRIAPHLATREEVLTLLREIYPPDRESLGVIVLEIEPDGAPGT